MYGLGYQHEACALFNYRICNDYSSADDSIISDDTVLTASVSESTPHSFESPPGSGCFCGISVTLLTILAQQHSLRLKLIPANQSSIFSTPDNYTYYGSTSAVLHGLANLSVLPLAVNDARVRHFSLINSYAMVRDYQLIIHQRWLVDSGIVSGSVAQSLLHNCTWELWVGLLAASMALTIALVVTRLVSPFRRASNAKELPANHGSNAHGIRTLREICQISLRFAGVFFNQESYHPKVFVGCYVAVLVWSLYGLFVNLLLTAGLSSDLASSVIIPPFSTLRGFIQSGFQPLAEVGTTHLSIMNQTSLSELMPISLQYDARTSGVSFIDYAAALSQTNKIGILCSMREMPSCQGSGFVKAAQTGVSNFVSLFQMQPQSTLAKNLSATIMRLDNTGVLERIINAHTQIDFAAHNGPWAVPGGQQGKVKHGLGLSVFGITFSYHLAVCGMGGLIFLLEHIGKRT